jgi:hypothetical protein
MKKTRRKEKKEVQVGKKTKKKKLTLSYSMVCGDETKVGEAGTIIV